ncbi:sensor histidine kinase [Phenylobacterium sp.]|uniref:sensor histidine kinase n=1 Tax=Phenylobacterium sp. TaxID=1871053 RepID=UPI0025E6C5A0|nr:sensor histidine kinase [Phenylobacterium sp.]
MPRPTPEAEHFHPKRGRPLYGAAASDAGLARELSAARARLESQDRQIQELNHRVANSLQLAADMLVFEQLRSRDPIAQAALEASRARLVAVGELHRYLYDHADRPTVALRPFLTGLGKAITATTGLQCFVQADGAAVPGDMAQQLAIAVNELAINTAKHAYDGRPGGRLDVVARREGGDLVLTVSDDGKGLDPGVKPQGPGGLGMTIVAAIVRDLHGTLTARSEGGACFTIRAPLPASAPALSRSFKAWNLD